jgi:hypothetical protein
MEANEVVCQIAPPYKRLSWWKFNDSKHFLLLGYWYSNQRNEWRMEFLELGIVKSIIRSESKFQQQIDDGLMVEYIKESL